jgi:DnaJ-class molecular chaperone
VSEQLALETLVGLGAAIDADVTAETLRSVFRMLARRHHPDRHPRSSDLERASQSAVFARIHDAYRRLQPVASAS